MPSGYTLVEGAEVTGDGDEMEVHFAMDDIRIKAEDESRAYDFLATGIIKSILERTNDLAMLYVICSQKLYYGLTGEGNSDFRSIK